MDRSKTKNFIITLLLLVNAFLLVILVLDKKEQRESDKDQRKSLYMVFEEAGIELCALPDALDYIPQSYEIVRDEDKELEFAKELLGATSVFDQGGNILLYDGEDGTGTFRSGGELELRISESPSKQISPESVIKIMTKTLGHEWSLLQDSEDTFTYISYFEDAYIYNAKLSFYFEDEDLSSIVGTRVLDTVFPNTETICMDLPTILMRFLDITRTEGKVFQTITELEMGYIQAATVSGASQLTPVWKLVTDVGDFYVNGVTGTLEQQFS